MTELRHNANKGGRGGSWSRLKTITLVLAIFGLFLVSYELTTSSDDAIGLRKEPPTATALGALRAEIEGLITELQELRRSGQAEVQGLMDELKELKSSCGTQSAAVVMTTAKNKPKTAAEAKRNLAMALQDSWQLQADFTRTTISSPRFFLDKFIQETANGIRQQREQGGQKIQTCLDWSDRYVKNFACQQVVDFQYSGDRHEYEPPSSSNKKHGTIQGDLGQDMSYVPEGLIDVAIVTQVFEHVPHFWNAARNLVRLLSSDGGILLFSIPWAYELHPHPGDFQRLSWFAVIHMFESLGMSLCQFTTDGWRSLQLHALGLAVADVELGYLLNQEGEMLRKGGSNFNFVFQKTKEGEEACQLKPMKLTGDATHLLEAQKAKYWPEPMKTFPLEENAVAEQG